MRPERTTAARPPEGLTFRSPSILHPANEQSVATVLTGKTTEFRLRRRDSVRFRALVKMTGQSGWLEVKTESTFGGTDTKRVTTKMSGT